MLSVALGLFLLVISVGCLRILAARTMVNPMMEEIWGLPVEVGSLSSHSFRGFYTSQVVGLWNSEPSTVLNIMIHVRDHGG